MLSPTVSVLHTAECELRLDSFSCSQIIIKSQHKTLPYMNFPIARKSLSWIYNVKGIYNNSTQNLAYQQHPHELRRFILFLYERGIKRIKYRCRHMHVRNSNERKYKLE
jgi:hypothetical protein